MKLIGPGTTVSRKYWRTHHGGKMRSSYLASSLLPKQKPLVPMLTGITLSAEAHRLQATHRLHLRKLLQRQHQNNQTILLTPRTDKGHNSVVIFKSENAHTLSAPTSAAETRSCAINAQSAYNLVTEHKSARPAVPPNPPPVVRARVRPAILTARSVRISGDLRRRA